MRTSREQFCKEWVARLFSEPQPDQVLLDRIDDDMIHTALRDRLVGIPSPPSKIEDIAVHLDEKTKTGLVKAWDGEKTQVLNLELSIEDQKTLCIEELKISHGIDVSEVNYGQRGKGVCNAPVLGGLILALAPIVYRAGFKAIRNDPADERVAKFYETIFAFKDGQLFILDKTSLLILCRAALRLRSFRIN